MPKPARKQLDTLASGVFVSTEDGEPRKVDVAYLDLETVQEIKYAARGLPETEVTLPDSNDCRSGNHDAFSDVTGLLTFFEKTLRDSDNQ